MIPKNKRISILHPNLNKKGWAVKMMIYLSNALVLEWNDVKLYTFSYDKELFSQDINFEVICSNKIAISYKIRKSDYIIVWNSPMQFVWAFSKLVFRSRATLIWWHHHYPWYYSENTNFLTLMKRYLEKLALKNIDLLVANSVYIKNELKNIYNRDSKILNPVADDVFFQNFKEKNDFSNKIIFTYGRWEQWKNIKQIFDTYEYLKDKINFNLLIWWVWKEMEIYKEKFKTDKNLSFLWLLDINSIINNLNKSHILLFPSKIDSFWISALEAQLSGVPIVAFDIPWINEIVIDNETGFLVKDSKDFSLKTLTLLSDNELINKFSKNSFKIHSKYNKTNFLNQLDDIL